MIATFLADATTIMFLVEKVELATTIVMPTEEALLGGLVMQTVLSIEVIAHQIERVMITEL
jgi:hypothetical protein